MTAWLHLFIPHEKNNHQPHFTRQKGLATILLFIITVQSTLNFFTSSSTNPTILGFATNIYQQELINLTNNERTSAGFSSLTHNPILDEAARLKAQNMFEEEYWAHVSPSGIDPWHWFEAVGYDYFSAGENLAKGFDTSNGVVNAWMASPSHRENILHDKFTEIGMAVVNGELEGEEVTLVVQLFGTPVPSQSVEQIAQAAPQPTATTAPTNIPVQVPTEPVFIPPTNIPALLVPTTITVPTATTIPFLEEDPTPTPVQQIAINQTNRPNGPTFSSSTGFVASVSDDFEQTPLFNTVLDSITSMSISRAITIVTLLFVVAAFMLESVIYWRKGLLRQNSHKLIHSFILVIITVSIWFGAQGQIL